MTNKLLFISLLYISSCGVNNEESHDVKNEKFNLGDNYIAVPDSITVARFDTCSSVRFKDLFAFDTTFKTPKIFPDEIDRDSDWDYMAYREIIYFNSPPVEAYRVRFYSFYFDHQVTGVYYEKNNFEIAYTDTILDQTERKRIADRLRTEVLPILHSFWETHPCTNIKEQHVPTN
ncbi:MAG: hypothetical protein GQ574_28590 [Crocinitomix sp.]|nr:hypothetical protein [Crocinitomix sp.]